MTEETRVAGYALLFLAIILGVFGGIGLIFWAVISLVEYMV